VPVIAPETAPVMEVMKQGVHGILIQPNSDAIIKAILKLRDPFIRNKLAANWKRQVLEKHTWRHNALKALEAFNPKNNQLA